MKALKILFLLFAMFLTASQSYAYNPNDSLRAYWSFEDSTAKDFSGNGLHGTLMNKTHPVLGYNGKGTAMYLEGTGVSSDQGGHILLPFIDFKNLCPEFTISMWVKEDSMTYWHGEAYIFFGDYQAGCLRISNHFQNDPSDNKLKIGFTVGDINSADVLHTPFDYSHRGKWVNYCMTYSKGYTRGYVNGIFIGQKQQTINVNGTNASIGRFWWLWGASTSTRFVGAVDEVKIWCRALSDKEIKKLIDTCDVSAKISCNNALCEGDTLYLYSSISGTSNFSWSGPDGFSTNLPNPIIPNMTKAKAGKYILQADSSGCYDSDTVLVTVNHPTAKISCNNDLCEGDTLFLSSSITGASSFSWSGPEGFYSTSQNPAIKNIKKTKAGKYFLTAYSPGCTAIDSVIVNVKRKINFKITSNTPLCYGDVALLFVPSDTGCSYNWTGPNGFSSNIPYIMIPNFGKNQSGFYRIKITGYDLCPFIDSVEILGTQKSKFIFQLPDTTGLIGTKDFHIPLKIYSDSTNFPVLLKSVKTVIVIKKSAYLINGVTSGSFTLATQDSFEIITLDFGDLIINSSVQTLTEIKGDILDDKIFTPITLKAINFQKDTCQNLLIKNGSLNVLCDITSFDYINFNDPGNIFFVGQAIGKIDNYIRLAQSKNYQSASMWYKKPLPLTNGFTTRFKFRFSEGSNNGSDDGSLPGADGIAFVIQNNDINQLGMSGGGIGYDGITNSLAIEFDTYSNDSTQIENFFDPNGNHVAVQSNGNKPNSAKHIKPTVLAINDKILTIRSDGTIYYIKIDYNITPNTLRVYLDTTDNFLQPCIVLDKFDISKLFDLIDGCKAFIGITSATGTAWQNHDILSWDICPKPCGSPINYFESIEKILEDVNVYPNPFNNSVFIHYKVENSSKVILRVFDIFGNEVSTIVDRFQDSGDYRATWNASDAAIGVYYFILSINGKTSSGKIIYSK